MARKSTLADAEALAQEIDTLTERLARQKDAREPGKFPKAYRDAKTALDETRTRYRREVPADVRYAIATLRAADNPDGGAAAQPEPIDTKG